MAAAYGTSAPSPPVSDQVEASTAVTAAGIASATTATVSGSTSITRSTTQADPITSVSGALAAVLPAALPTRLEDDGSLDANALDEALSFDGVPWCASRSKTPGCCYFWYHLPHASERVQMRWRLAGARRWQQHPVAVQVLPGGWWRTGEWEHAGDMTYEQSCWVGGRCVMAGIRGPAESHLLSSLPPGTSPPSPHGIGTNGVHIEGGFAYLMGSSAVGETETSGFGRSIFAEPDIERGAAATPVSASLQSTLVHASDAGSPPRQHASPGLQRRLGPSCDTPTPAGPATPSLRPATPASALAAASNKDTHAVATEIDGSAALGAASALRDSYTLPTSDMKFSGDGFVMGERGQVRVSEERQVHEARALSERLERATGTSTGEQMVWNGLRYTRIWSLHAPARGAAGGGFDLPADTIVRLASSATSIHIRLHDDDSESVTLNPGVVWPLQQLQRGLPFDSTPHGLDVTPAIARVTWSGARHLVDAMWNKGTRERREGNSLHAGRLFFGCGNPNGLRLVASEHCEWIGKAAAVEVWLGEPLAFMD